MVHPRERTNDSLHQFREAPTQDTATPPYPGEVIGGRTKGPFEVVGLDALSPLFASIPFPATKEDVIEAIGQAHIPVSKFETANVADLVERTAPNEFRSSMELEAALKRVLQQSVPQGERGSHHKQSDDLQGREPQTGS